MSELLERVSGFLLAPAVPAARPAARPATTGAVVGAPAAARAAGAALALVLRRGSAACVAVWDPSRPDGAPAPSGGTPGARRLVARLRAHGFEARGRGRLAWVELPGDPAGAAAGWERLTGRIDAPTVLVVAGARAATLDTGLADADRVLLVAPPGADAALAQLALAGLPHAEVVAPLGLVARWAALAGIGCPGAAIGAATA